MRTYTTGAHKSPFDIRTFAYKPELVKANVKGGERWLPEDIEDQHQVGICTAISTVMRAQKFFGKKFSPEFQYLMQKRSENNWDEGSSISTALKIGKNVGFLPIENWTATTEEDRKLPYAQYIEKLKAVSEADITKFIAIAGDYKIQAYASVPVTRDDMANAIDAHGSLLNRVECGATWWTPPIEPLQAPNPSISGHAINVTNYDGDSYRIANSWGTEWAEQGTAYSTFSTYKPTEAWAVWFTDVPPHIQKQIDSRSTIIGKIMDLLQQIIKLLPSLV